MQVAPWAMPRRMFALGERNCRRLSADRPAPLETKTKHFLTANRVKMSRTLTWGYFEASPCAPRFAALATSSKTSALVVLTKPCKNSPRGKEKSGEAGVGRPSFFSCEHKTFTLEHRIRQPCVLNQKKPMQRCVSRMGRRDERTACTLIRHAHARGNLNQRHHKKQENFHQNRSVVKITVGKQTTKTRKSTRRCVHVGLPSPIFGDSSAVSLRAHLLKLSMTVLAVVGDAINCPLVL